MEQPRANILIALNCSLAPEPEAIIALYQAQTIAYANGINSSIVVSKNANQGFIVAQFYSTYLLKEKQYTHLLLTADDVQLPQDAIVRLVNDDKDIVSGIYRMREPTKYWLAIYLEEKEKIPEYVANGAVIQTKYASGHSMLIKRDVVETMSLAYPQLNYEAENGQTLCGLFLPAIENGKIYLDDWVFCKRAAKCGFTSWLDFGVHLRHKCESWLEVAK